MCDTPGRQTGLLRIFLTFGRLRISDCSTALVRWYLGHLLF